MNEKYVCGFCGKTHTDLDEYMNCVAKCGEKLKELEKEAREKKRLEELNAAINRIKQAETYLEEQKKIMKENFPAEYELNFGSKNDCNCPSECKGCNEKTEDDTESSNSNNSCERIEVKVVNDGNGRPKIDAKINGKKVDDKILKELSADPEITFLTKMFGLF